MSIVSRAWPLCDGKTRFPEYFITWPRCRQVYQQLQGVEEWNDGVGGMQLDDDKKAGKDAECEWGRQFGGDTETAWNID
jgi:hypothetical protein